MKSFYFWATIAPAGTLFVLFQYTNHSSENAGYALPFIAMGAVAIILIAATIIGLLTKTFKTSISGALVGLPLSYLTVLLFTGVLNFTSQKEINAKDDEFRNLLTVLQSGKKDEIALGLKNLKNISAPLAMCILSGSREGPYASLLTPVNSTAILPKYPFSLNAILDINETAAGLNLPGEEIDAIFYQSLKAITERSSVPHFAHWATLWDKTHAQQTTRTIQIIKPYRLKDNYCGWGSTLDVVSEVIETWSDEGILAWLNTNHIFIPEQQRYVLKKVMSATTLEKMIVSGTDINAKYPGETKDATGLTSLMAQRAYSFSQMINEAKDPASVTQLVQSFVRLGADLKSKDSGRQTPCQIFSATETYLNKNNSESKSSFTEKQKAFKAIQKLLCTV